MSSTQPIILHVEDEPLLTEAVEMSFEALGFHGTFLSAHTLAAGIATIDERSREGAPLDLILSDINLPDGSGLDLIDTVKSHPDLALVPVLILSGDTAPETVTHAYALGANCYVSKSDLDIEALYGHLLSAVLAEQPEPSRLRELLARAMRNQGWYAGYFMQLARRFSDSPSEARFWLTSSLGEANLENLIAFLRGRVVHEVDVPPELLERTDEALRLMERSLRRVMAELADNPRVSEDQVRAQLLDLLEPLDPVGMAQLLSVLFPAAAVAIGAVSELFVTQDRRLLEWIERRPGGPEDQQRAAAFRAKLDELEALTDWPAAH